MVVEPNLGHYSHKVSNSAKWNCFAVVFCSGARVISNYTVDRSKQECWSWNGILAVVRRQPAQSCLPARQVRKTGIPRCKVSCIGKLSYAQYVIVL